MANQSIRYLVKLLEEKEIIKYTFSNILIHPKKCWRFVQKVLNKQCYDFKTDNITKLLKIFFEYPLLCAVDVLQQDDIPNMRSEEPILWR